jgi:hypothetical protein
VHAPERDSNGDADIFEAFASDIKVLLSSNWSVRRWRVDYLFYLCSICTCEHVTQMYFWNTCCLNCWNWVSRTAGAWLSVKKHFIH